MRVAAIYDIHGNLPALEAVLAEIERDGADLIVVGGDVLPGPMPVECLAKLFDLGPSVRFLRGNGENDVLRIRRGEVPERVPPPFRETLAWVADELPPHQVAEIETWPATVRVEIDDVGVLFCHATPRDDNELFTRVTPEEHLRPIIEEAGAPVIVCGHTHMQFDRRIGDARVLNAGSVGMPFGDPGAHWLLLEPAPVFRRTTYDFAAAEALIRATSYPLAADVALVSPPPEHQMVDVFESAALRGGSS